MNVEAKLQPPYARVRAANRADYDRATIHAILDAAIVAHVGFVDDGRPMVIPMIFGLIGDTIYLHGAKATRIIKRVGETAPLCLTVTHVDGLVVARSAFHHSINYRSAVIHGTARHVTDSQEHERALVAVTEHLLPGRWDEARPMTEKESRATGVLALDIEAASAKIRQGPPVDDEADHDLPIWGGVLPVATAIAAPVHDGRMADGGVPPASLLKARRKFGA
ncbi:pyridoxamine 5'-phosphate oxidase family protein [Stappia sp. F7233]|uniref:Pyridoxamine 5'-phosphate oxidase family protein n=1 Tax=Stappia albiluteola TaxID=2758565 RepID=A0A839AGC8_9HYPH|nr:pyridoxamine 5'-phosphate oxidase family protein [Stappia albiluteola]MBA5777817.1 pyridoxamine 5'-phosphate oxidase family protein [Stappia albiluteola]